MNEIAKTLAKRIFDQKLIGNEYRSAFLEAMIEPYLQPFGWKYVGNGWYGWDFEREPDMSRLELKQSAAMQTWSDRGGVRTRGLYDIAPRTGYFRKDGRTFDAVPGRCAHTYVFAWNGFYGDEADHRDTAQWVFYVIPTSALPERQKTISLSRVRRLAESVGLQDLAETVDAATPSL